MYYDIKRILSLTIDWDKFKTPVRKLNITPNMGRKRGMQYISN